MSLPIGTLGFTRITGVTGWFVSLGQFLLGDACRFSHVFMVISDTEIIEAMPGGVRTAPIDRPYKTEVLYIDFPLDEMGRESIEFMAPTFKGKGYSFASYLALSLIRLGIQPKRLIKYIEESKRPICSQLADQLLLLGNYHAFSDGRWQGDVSPADLVYLGLEKARIVKIQD